MKPIFHPQLVNPPNGDPALFVDFLFEKRALLFDVGDLASLAPRKMLRLSHVFISHTHMDHFIGFDHLLRVLLGRAKTLHVFGPAGLVAQVGHKLAGYTWNLVQNYEADFTVLATEIDSDGNRRMARFRCRTGFEEEGTCSERLSFEEPLVDEQNFWVQTRVLDHRIPCLAFALQEKRHINVWKNRLQEMGLPTGPWLTELKQAILRDEPQDTLIRIRWRRDGHVCERYEALGKLQEQLVRVTPGQRIAYVADTVYHEKNAQQIVALAQHADCLFIEAAFLAREAERAARTYHLTATQAGWLGRRAGAKRLVPFHFSARHSGEEQRLVTEAMTAFSQAEAADRMAPMLR